MLWNSRWFPGTNLQDINLDWILKKISALRGGGAGQYLYKKSDNDFDFGWKAGSPSGVSEEEFEELKQELSPLNNYFYYYVDAVNGNDENDGLTPETATKTLDAVLAKHYERDIRIRFLTEGVYKTTAQYFAGMSFHLVNYTVEYGGALSPVTVYFTDTHSIQFYNCYTHFENIKIDFANDLYFDGGFAYHINNVEFIKPVKFNGMNVVADGITYNKVALQESNVKLRNITLTTTDNNDHSIYLRDSKSLIYGTILSQATIENDNNKAIIFTVRGELTYALSLPSNPPASGRTYGLVSQQTNLYATETRLRNLGRAALQGNNIQSNYPCVIYKGDTLLDLQEVKTALDNKMNIKNCGVVNSANPMQITFTGATRGFIAIYGASTRQAMFLLNCNAGAAPVTNMILQSESDNFTLTSSVTDGNGVLTIEAVASNNCTVFVMLFTNPDYVQSSAD